ncbi:hypothetical protein SDC9_94481 [bioreactor metagenome]|uniref:Uncharacterized protein n=1 Tax=bioreactor metagenome TaxID=1076179 RepID=A0A645A3J8_9ZZZZ
MNFIDDRGLDPGAPGEGPGPERGADAFGHHHAHFGQNRRQLLASSQLFPDMPVAAVAAGAGHDQVADAAQTRKGLRLAAQRFAQPSHFGDAAGHQRGLGVVAELHAVDDAGGDGDHIFQGAAKLQSDHIAAGVNPEFGVHEGLLDQFGLIRDPAGRHHRGRHLPRHLFGMARAGKHRITHVAEHRGNHFADPEPAVFLDALGDVDQQRPPGGVIAGGQLLQHAAQELRRRRQHREVAAGDGARHVGFKTQLIGKHHAFQEALVAPGGGHLRQVIRERAPHGDFVAVGGEYAGQRAAPAAVAENDGFHNINLPISNGVFP